MQSLRDWNSCEDSYVSSSSGIKNMMTWVMTNIGLEVTSEK